MGYVTGSRFRHFDSASVEHGFIGGKPKTGWLITYPLLERIHYLLAAGANRQPAAGGIEIGVLSPAGRVGDGGLTQTNESPEFPGASVSMIPTKTGKSEKKGVYPDFPKKIPQDFNELKFPSYCC